MFTCANTHTYTHLSDTSTSLSLSLPPSPSPSFVLSLLLSLFCSLSPALSLLLSLACSASIALSLVHLLSSILSLSHSATVAAPRAGTGARHRLGEAAPPPLGVVVAAPPRPGVDVPPPGVVTAAGPQAGAAAPLASVIKEITKERALYNRQTYRRRLSRQTKNQALDTACISTAVSRDSTQAIYKYRMRTSRVLFGIFAGLEGGAMWRPLPRSTPNPSLKKSAISMRVCGAVAY